MDYPEYRKINTEFEVAVLINTLDPLEIATIINKLMNDDAHLQVLHENCLKAREELNWQKEETK